MTVRRVPLALSLWIGICLTTITICAHAEDEVAKLCFECHTADDNNPDPIIPKLIGQNKAYMLKEMNSFKTGARFDTAMADIAKNLTDTQELNAILDFFATRPVMKGEPSQDAVVETGKYIYTQRHCDFCHGSKGKLGDIFINGAPIIGGQNREYLYKTMLDLRHSKRPSDPFSLMQRSLLQLSSDEIEAVSAYLAAQ